MVLGTSLTPITKLPDAVGVYRHLAEKWATTYLSPHHKRRLFGLSGFTELSTIEHLILLDLLGAADPSIRSYFLDTAWLFDGLVTAEHRLRDSGALHEFKQSSWKSFFVQRKGSDTSFGYIGDDHLPFLKRGVSILHLIANPFPRVWHTLKVIPFSECLAT